MENTNLSNFDITNKVNAKFNIFWQLVLPRFGGRVNSTYIVIVSDNGCMKIWVKFLQGMVDPYDFGYYISNLPVFFLYNGRETICYHLDDYDRRLSPRNMH